MFKNLRIESKIDSKTFLEVEKLKEHHNIKTNIKLFKKLLKTHYKALETIKINEELRRENNFLKNIVNGKRVF